MLACGPEFRYVSKPISSHTIFAQGVGPLKPDTVGPTNLDKLTVGICPLPLKSAEVLFNPARRWFVPLQLARIEGPWGVSCDFGP